MKTRRQFFARSAAAFAAAFATAPVARAAQEPKAPVVAAVSDADLDLFVKRIHEVEARWFDAHGWRRPNRLTLPESDRAVYDELVRRVSKLCSGWEINRHVFDGSREKRVRFPYRGQVCGYIPAWGSAEITFS